MVGDLGVVLIIILGYFIEGLSVLWVMIRFKNFGLDDMLSFFFFHDAMSL